MKRYCYHADESYVSPDGGFTLIRVEENSPGFIPVTSFDDVEMAKERAREFNDRLGLTEKEVMDIRASSFAAGNNKSTYQAFVRVVFTTPEWHSEEAARDILAEDIKGLGAVTVHHSDVFLIQEQQQDD